MENKIDYNKIMIAEKQKIAAKVKLIKEAKRKWYINLYKKIAKYIFISCIMLILLIYPKHVGMIIGQWINDFLGTIIKESIK